MEKEASEDSWGWLIMGSSSLFFFLRGSLLFFLPS